MLYLLKLVAKYKKFLLKTPKNEVYNKFLKGQAGMPVLPDEQMGVDGQTGASVLLVEQASRLFYPGRTGVPRLFIPVEQTPSSVHRLLTPNFCPHFNLLSSFINGII